MTNKITLYCVNCKAEKTSASEYCRNGETWVWRGVFKPFYHVWMQARKKNRVCPASHPSQIR